MGRNIHPLFSSPVCTSTIEEDLKDVFNSIKKLKYISANNNGTYTSETRDVLSKFPSLKKALLKEFNDYKNTCLHYEDTDFFITTSWITKCIHNSSSHKHNHQNALYSGVLYFQEGENFAGIRFSNENLIPQQILLRKPTEWNLLNSSSWVIKPAPNQVVIFPSYLFHEVTFHGASEDRYSLAFNLFPQGTLGESDSLLKV